MSHQSRVRGRWAPRVQRVTRRPYIPLAQWGEANQGVEKRGREALRTPSCQPRPQKPPLGAHGPGCTRVRVPNRRPDELLVNCLKVEVC